MIGLEQKIFSWRLVIILRRSQTLWVNSSLYLQIWNITVTPRPCWNVTIPGFSHTSLSMVTSPSWVVTSYHLAAKCPLDISIVRCSLTCGRPSTDQPSVAAHCSQPSSAHITHWRLQRQPNTDCCSVLSPDWLMLTLCSALIGATRQHFSYCWQTCSDSWAPTLTSPGLAKFSTGIPHELGAAAFPEPERSNSLVWTEMCLRHVTDYCPQLVTRCATTDKTLRKSWWRFNFALTTLSN